MSRYTKVSSTELSSERLSPTKNSDGGFPSVVDPKRFRMFKFFDCDFIIAFNLIDAIRIWEEHYHRISDNYHLDEIALEELYPQDEIEVWWENDKIAEHFSGQLCKKSVAELLVLGRGFLCSTEY